MLLASPRVHVKGHSQETPSRRFSPGLVGREAKEGVTPPIWSPPPSSCSPIEALESAQLSDILPLLSMHAI